MWFAIARDRSKRAVCFSNQIGGVEAGWLGIVVCVGVLTLRVDGFGAKLVQTCMLSRNIHL
jgi:hypothetical protein